MARHDDLAAMRAIMHAAIQELQRGFLTPQQVAASVSVMGLDTQLVHDGTYFAAEAGGHLIGCGGWSRRATLYGGDDSAVARQPRLLDATCEPARIRAMYTHPAHARQGVGRALLTASEEAARAAGFRAAELMATLSGEPLYRQSGYAALEHIEAMVGNIAVPLIRMRKALA